MSVKKSAEMIDAKQKRIIWSIAKKSIGMDSETLYAIIWRMFEHEHMSGLTFLQAECLIRELKRNAAGLSSNGITEPQYRKIMAMAAGFGWPPSHLREFIEKESGVGDVKWLSSGQARAVITGMEKIRKWRSGKEGAADGLQ
jgi:hypothetical protein